MLKDYEGSHLINHLVITSLFVIALISLFTIKTIYDSLPLSAITFLFLWLVISICCSLFTKYNFTVGWLTTTFSMIVSWRIAALYHLDFLYYPFFLVFILLIINFAICIYKNLRYPENTCTPLSVADWQIVFIRIYLGFDFIPHFTEKLFAGPIPHLEDVHDFVALNVAFPNLMVWLAGICELIAALSLGLGFVVRLGALFAAGYLLVATILGKHFTLGFIWANSGGGWEYPLMWVILVLSFAITAQHHFSVDEELEHRFKFNRWLKNIL